MKPLEGRTNDTTTTAALVPLLVFFKNLTSPNFVAYKPLHIDAEIHENFVLRFPSKLIVLLYYGTPPVDKSKIVRCN